MEVQLVRHATLLVTMSGVRILVDPMLGEVGAAPAVANSPHPRPNPLTPLPLPASTILTDVAAVLVTHTHRDHFDEAAARFVPKSLPLFGQPEDETKFAGMGFSDVRAVEGTARWNGIEFHRTGGRHGTGEIGRRMAPVSGFVLSAPGEPTLYIAGDTIWCAEVESALREYAPSAAVVNAGAAQFLEGDPITMTAEDVIATARSAPAAQIVAVHMEAINHCLLTRAELRERVRAGGVADRVRILGDGETLRI